MATDDSTLMNDPLDSSLNLADELNAAWDEGSVDTLEEPATQPDAESLPAAA